MILLSSDDGDLIEQETQPSPYPVDADLQERCQHVIDDFREFTVESLELRRRLSVVFTLKPTDGIDDPNVPSHTFSISQSRNPDQYRYESTIRELTEVPREHAVMLLAEDLQHIRDALRSERSGH